MPAVLDRRDRSFVGNGWHAPKVTVTKSPASWTPTHTTRTYAPGQVCLDALPGSLVLVGHKGMPARAIRAFERLRVPSPFCWTNHACVTLDGGPNAQVVQEGAKGPVVTPLASLVHESVTVTEFKTARACQLRAGFRFLESCMGQGYGWLTLPADAFNALTGAEISFGWGNRMVCSTQTCRFLERLGLVPDRSPYAVTPAHLAWYFGITEPKGWT